METLFVFLYFDQNQLGSYKQQRTCAQRQMETLTISKTWWVQCNVRDRVLCWRSWSRNLDRGPLTPLLAVQDPTGSVLPKNYLKTGIMRLFQNCTASNKYQNFEEEKNNIDCWPSIWRLQNMLSASWEPESGEKDVKILRLSFVMAKLKSEARWRDVHWTWGSSFPQQGLKSGSQVEGCKNSPHRLDFVMKKFKSGRQYPPSARFKITGPGERK